MGKTTFEISWLTLWRIFFFVLLVSLMYLGSNILLGLFLALVISSGLEILVNLLERLGLPRILGAIIVFLAVIFVIVVILYTVVPLLIVNTNAILLELNKSSSKSWWGQFVNLRATHSINTLINQAVTKLFSGDTSPLDLFSQLLGGLSLTVSVFIISFYLSLSPAGVERFIRAVFPADYEEVALKIYENSRRKIGLWFRAQIILSSIMGILVWLALLILGVKYAFLLGILAGILELVPFVGPILAGAAAILTALLTSLPLALYTLIVFLALQQFESNILVPLLTRRAVGLHPIIVIIALLMGIEIGGLLGAIIAIPAAAVFQEIVEGWPTRKQSREAEV